MGRIHVLPETVQNKIAAGEVVERPASVVKELIENSLDAGATQISVHIEEGGHRLIRIADDGAGMDEEDLVAAMQRHATSKIADVDDIFRIGTFGFRGEALPSIGSVSRMTIVTATPGATEGRELAVDGGALVRLAPAPARRGTQIEVRDIFFNTPARRKFLKSPASEGTQTLAVVSRLALGNPGVGFRFQNGDKLTLSVRPVATQLERMADVFGADLTAKMLPFEKRVNDGLSFSGYVARPPECSPNAGAIYLLVNQRWIKNFGLSRALADAFQGAIPPRRYPKAVVNVSVDPGRIDVNVHPAKEEIRFDDDRALIGEIRAAVRDALGRSASASTFASLPPSSPSPARTWPAAEFAGEARQPKPQSQPQAEKRPAEAADEVQGRLDMPSALSGPRRRDLSGLDLAAARERIRAGDRPKPDAATAQAAPASPSPSTQGSAPAGGAAPTVEREGMTVGPPGRHRILGQAGSGYILVDGPEGLILVDPHALHERWNYDRLVAAHADRPAAKTLLLPIEMKLSPLEAGAAAEAVPVLAEFGFEFRLPSPDRMAVTAIPAFMPAEKIDILLRQVLADAGGARAAVESARERLLASLACRASVLLGKALPEEEMLGILDKFFNQGQLPTCPHGRPTAIRIGWGEVNRRFGR